MSSEESHSSQETSPRVFARTSLRSEDIHYIVFGGGGIRGVAFASALEELFNLLHFDPVERLHGCAGTSAGALYAAALIAGIPVARIRQIAESTNISDLINAQVTTLVAHWGLDCGNGLVDYLDEHLGGQSITFAQLYRQTGKDLVVVVTNMNSAQVEYWSHRNQPDMPVAVGVATSMALPPVFAPRVIDGICYVDGGLMDNYPHHLFPRTQTLGFRVRWGQIQPGNINGFEKYFSRLTFCTLTAAERVTFEHMDLERRRRTVEIDCQDVETFTWRLTPTIIENLRRQGRAAVRSFVLASNLRSLTDRVRSVATQTDPAMDSNLTAVHSNVTAAMDPNVNAVRPDLTGAHADDAAMESSKL